jgi:hypothetical protein
MRLFLVAGAPVQTLSNGLLGCQQQVKPLGVDASRFGGVRRGDWQVRTTRVVRVGQELIPGRKRLFMNPLHY